MRCRLFATSRSTGTAALGAAEREGIIAWARQTRRGYATADAPDGIKGDLLQPLPLRVIVDEKKARLGEKLYHDKRLSGDGTLSCASCHDLAKGGTDQLPVSVGIRGQKGPINSPTIFNAGFQNPPVLGRSCRRPAGAGRRSGGESAGDG